MMRRRTAWTPMHLGLLALMLGMTLWMFRTPLLDIAALAWRDEEHSHILLAPLVMLWLVWLRSTRLAYIRVQPNPLGCGIVAAGCICSWWGFQTDTYLAWHAGGLVALLGMLISMTGLNLLRQFAPVVLAMAFLVPVPGTIRHQIALPLQELTTRVTHSCLELFGYQAARMGNVLIINGEHVAVAEACNGMRLVFSLTLVVYAFVFSVPLRQHVRLGLLLLSPFVALAANVLRLVPTSLLYGMVSPGRAEVFHDLSGWIMLPVALLALIGVLKLLKWLDLPVSSYRLASP